MPRNSAAIAAIILAVAALGVGGFLVYGIYFQPREQTKVVGVWDSLARNAAYAPHNTMADYLAAASSPQLITPEYLSIADAGTAITLLKVGWYRINLKVYLTDIDASATYLTRLIVNDDVKEFFDQHITSSSPESTHHMIDAEVTYYNNGTSAILINMICTDGDTNFAISTNQFYNQLVIDYLVT